MWNYELVKKEKEVFRIEFREEKTYNNIEKFILEGLLGYRTKNAKEWKDLPKTFEEFSETSEEVERENGVFEWNPSHTIAVFKEGETPFPFIKNYNEEKEVTKIIKTNELVEIHNKDEEVSFFRPDLLAELLSITKGNGEFFCGKDLPLLIKMRDRKNFALACKKKI